MEDIIRTEHLTFSYPESEDEIVKPAVRDVSIGIEKGSLVAILGPNGSGKSTLAKLMALSLVPDSGELYINGKELTGENVSDDDILDGRKTVGIVFQNPDNQIVSSIVEEDVAFGPENLGVPSAEIRKRVDEALETVGMTEYAKQAPYDLSGGQKQRVAIAGAIAMRRDCIIFDESTAMLDPMGRRDVMSTIFKLNKESGITVINITHYMNEATMADKVIVMNDGSVAMEGRPDEIFTKVDEIRRLGLDVPQTSALLEELRKRGLDVDTAKFMEHDCAVEIADAVRKKIKNRK